MSVTTNDSSHQSDQEKKDKFFYSWYSALLYGHEATGWGEFEFSANTSSAPFLPRPDLEPGRFFSSNVRQSGDRHSRSTVFTFLPFQGGTVWITTDDFKYGFDKPNTNIFFGILKGLLEAAKTGVRYLWPLGVF
jgi:hypothetical protein